MSKLKRKSGQFLPISAMVILSMVVFLVAVVNVYKIAQAKLQVQNFADAAALNVASSVIAASLNTIADRNEWLNNLYTGLTSPSDPSWAQSGQDPCAAYYSTQHGSQGKYSTLLPPLSCAGNNIGTGPRLQQSQVQNATQRYVFPGFDAAKAYATTVRTMNLAQNLFQDVYNNFMGAGTGTGNASSTANSGNLQDTLKQDIPALFSDPEHLHIVIWNDKISEPSTTDPSSLRQGFQGQDRDKPLQSQIKKGLQYVQEDIPVRIWSATKLPAGLSILAGGSKDPHSIILVRTLGQLLNPNDNGKTDAPPGNFQAPAVGWTTLNMNGLPMIQVEPIPGQKVMALGVGVLVVKEMPLAKIGPINLGPYYVTAKAKAYVVNGSGQLAPTNFNFAANGKTPTFQPKYYVKLAKS